MSDNIRVSAIAFFRPEDRKYLICRRGPMGSGAGAWEFPGGKIEPGETEKQALVREIKEELSVDIDENKLVFISDHVHQYTERKVHIYLFKYDVVKLDYQLVDHDFAQWVSLDQITNYTLTDADVPFIQRLKLI